jgi:hypothetical protein
LTSNRRRSSSASKESRRNERSRRGNSERTSSSYDEEEDLSSWEEEDEGDSGVEDSEEFLYIEIEEEDEEDFDLDVDSEEDSSDSASRTPKSGKSSSVDGSDDEGDSYWLSGSREDPDKTNWSEDDESDVSQGRSAEGLPKGVYSEDEEFNAVNRALNRGMGVVWVYGGSEASLKRWLSLYDGVIEDGGKPWIWIFSEGAGGGEIRFKRFSGDEESWKTIYKVPSSKADRSGLRELSVEVISVLEGYVPKRDRKVPFGRF